MVAPLSNHGWFTGHTSSNLPRPGGEFKGQSQEQVRTGSTLSLRSYSLQLQLRPSTQVRGELLDEGEQHGLGQRTRVLPKHLLRVHSLTDVQHQVEISCCQSLQGWHSEKGSGNEGQARDRDWAEAALGQARDGHWAEVTLGQPPLGAELSANPTARASRSCSGGWSMLQAHPCAGAPSRVHGSSTHAALKGKGKVRPQLADLPAEA